MVPRIQNSRTGPGQSLISMDESECLAEFRVRKKDITLLANVLQKPFSRLVFLICIIIKSSMHVRQFLAIL